jgi:hypothetical protein
MVQGSSGSVRCQDVFAYFRQYANHRLRTTVATWEVLSDCSITAKRASVPTFTFSSHYHFGDNKSPTSQHEIMFGGSEVHTPVVKKTSIFRDIMPFIR